jgi:uncharacterized caspase-like protein
MMKRAAVVIGVSKTGGGLAELDSPAAGADAFASWLKAEGFDVKTITDAAGPVTYQQVQDAIKAFVDAATYQQLVIYFSGHGYWKNDAELWLLTNAPADANAAISLVETAEFAKDCGIPSVVMISDACRSIPNTPQWSRVRGSIVFPNSDVARSRAKVDKFMAAAAGRPAYEVPLVANGRKESVFTHCFLRAFKAPDQEMIQSISDGGETIQVVPNRRLGKYLQREVAALLASVNIQLDQAPDAEVLSDEDTYIGRVHMDALESLKTAQARIPSEDGSRAPVEPVVHLRDVATVAVERALGQEPQITPEEARAIEKLASTSGFNDAVDQAKTVAAVAHFETETGFAIVGASIADAAPLDGARATILTPGGGRDPGIIRMEPRSSACSVAIALSNGRGTVLAALRGYIGHVLVDGNSITTVSYVPSDNSWRWPGYKQRRERIEQLRAAVAAAVRMGVFRLDDKERAARLAQQIRIDKGLDPALGLFAAYAYGEADRRDDIESVRRYMRDDLNADLFDVAMLARKLGSPSKYAPAVPLCPMLTQGWNFLRVRGVQLPPALDDAQDELERALWTTFKPARTKLIFDAIQRGEIT